MKISAFVDNDKGGTGKSFVAMALGDHALRRGIPFEIVEGDSSVPDVAARFSGIVPGVQVNMQRPDSSGDVITELGIYFEEVFSRVPLVIANTPAGSSATVGAQALDLIQPVLSALDVQVTTVFVLGQGIESLHAMEASLEGGLLAISETKIVVTNGFFGPMDRQLWYRSSLRSHWLEIGGIEFHLPRMIERVADHVRNLPGPFSDLATGRFGDLALVERAGLAAWIKGCIPLADAAFNGLGGMEEQA